MAKRYMRETERAGIVTMYNELIKLRGPDQQEVTIKEIAEKYHRSPVTVLQIIRTHPAVDDETIFNRDVAGMIASGKIDYKRLRPYAIRLFCQALRGDKALSPSQKYTMEVVLKESGEGSGGSGGNKPSSTGAGRPKKDTPHPVNAWETTPDSDES